MGQDRMFQTFKEMVGIDSESKEEGKFHAYLITLLQSLGMETVEDNSKESTGLGANNLIARLRGTPLWNRCSFPVIPIPLCREKTLWRFSKTASSIPRGEPFLPPTIRRASPSW